MRFSKLLVAATLALSMSSAPVLAQSAAPLSVASRSGAVMRDSNHYYEGRYIPGLVIIAILAAAILISHHHSRPHSP